MLLFLCSNSMLRLRLGNNNKKQEREFKREIASNRMLLETISALLLEREKARIRMHRLSVRVVYAVSHATKAGAQPFSGIGSGSQERIVCNAVQT